MITSKVLPFKEKVQSTWRTYADYKERRDHVLQCVSRATSQRGLRRLLEESTGQNVEVTVWRPLTHPDNVAFIEACDGIVKNTWIVVAVRVNGELF